MMPFKQTGELRLPARAALVVERIADGPQVSGGHAAIRQSFRYTKSMPPSFSPEGVVLLELFQLHFQGIQVAKHAQNLLRGGMTDDCFSSDRVQLPVCQ